jgi:hypothetical protein
MPRIHVNSIDMYYEIHGVGEPLVMVPAPDLLIVPARAFMEGLNTGEKGIADYR